MKEIPPRRRPILHRGARLTRRGPLLSFAGDRRSHRRDRSNPARSGARSAKLRSASALILPSLWTHNVYVNGASRGTGSPSSWASAAPSSLRDRFPPPLAGLASRVNGLGRWHENAIGHFFVAKAPRHRSADRGMEGTPAAVVQAWRNRCSAEASNTRRIASRFALRRFDNKLPSV